MTIMGVEITILIMWALVAVGTLSAAGFAIQFVRIGARSKRIKTAISQHRGELTRKQMENLTRPSAIRQQRVKPHVALMDFLLKKLNLQNVLVSDDLRNELAQAGLRGRNVVAAYISTRILMAIGGGIATLVLVGLMKKFPYPDFVRYIFAGLGTLVGFYLPKVLLANTATKRQKEMTDAFPDALDLLTICVEAGLGIEGAFARVTEEIVDASPILGQEFGLLSAELAYLGDRRQAYDNFAKRTGMPAAKALATALIQSEQYGTPVGVALKVLAKEKRDERMSAAEKKAAALPAKLTVPMIIFFLPVLFIVVIGPAAMQIPK